MRERERMWSLVDVEIHSKSSNIIAPELRLYRGGTGGGGGGGGGEWRGSLPRRSGLCPLPFTATLAWW